LGVREGAACGSASFLYAFFTVSKRAKILIAAIGLFLAIALIRFARREKTYEGKTLAEWTAQVRLFSSQGQDPEVRAAVCALCTNDLQALVQALEYNPEVRLVELRSKWGWLPKPILKAVLTDRKTRRAETAVRAFWALGSNASPAIPALTKLMYSDNFIPPMNAIRALSGLVTNSFPALLHAAGDPACPCRFIVSRALGQMRYLGPDAKGIVPVLISCMHDSDTRIVLYAMDALSELSIEPELSVPALRDAQQSTDEVVRRSATKALEKFETGAGTNSTAHE
jgi:hypothetical protein